MDYKDRMVVEYRELKRRARKLRAMLVRYDTRFDTGNHDFKLSCPAYLLREQLEVMDKYMLILEKRAFIEGIEL